MVGFLLAIPGLKHGRRDVPAQPHDGRAARNTAITASGAVLKLAQREDALQRGIRLIEWTFDPLEIKNAFFNIERLGAIVRRYVPNQYGTTSSPLHGGLPTDRCVAEWWLASRAAKRAGGPRRTPSAGARRSARRYRRHPPQRSRPGARAIQASRRATLRANASTAAWRSPASNAPTDAGTYLLCTWPSE